MTQILEGQEVYFLECPEGTLFNGKEGKTEQKLYCKCNKKTHVCKWRNENNNIVNKGTNEIFDKKHFEILVN